MKIQPFKLERYFALYEFKTRYLLSPSDCESLTMKELLALASPAGLQRWEALSLGYTESPGHPELRQTIAGQYERVEPEGVLVAAPEELILVFMQTILSPGDKVVALFPAYQSLYEVGRAIGCRVEFWPLRLEENGWRLDLDHLEALLSNGPRLLVLNFPHNPTGFLPRRAELEAIVGLARRYGVMIFSDEMYRNLEYSPGDRLPAMADLYERGVSLSGLSKSLALPGLRIGWLAGQDPGLAPRLLAVKDYTTICNSAPSEALALIALEACQTILGRNLAIVAANRTAAAEFCKRHPGRLAWIAPRAGSIAFPRYTGPEGVEAFARQAVEQREVMVVPGSMFDYPGEHFRIGLGRRNLPEALAQLEELWAP